MSDLSWWKEEDTAKVYARLRAQLEAINSLPYAKRSQYIEHEIRCARCDCVVVQVVALKYDADGADCQVIQWRDRENLPLDLPDPDGMAPGEHGRLAAEAIAARPKSHRPGEWRFQIVADDDLDRRSRVFPVCECANYTFTVSGVLARCGRKSTTRPPRA